VRVERSTGASCATNKTVEGSTVGRGQKQNAPDSIRFNRECDSNEIDVSESHLEKHDEPRISTLRGITID
jgi:hypothetical protein